MVDGVDAASTVHVLLADVVRLLGADTGGILVRGTGDGLELLAAHSHTATELEIHQANSASGPCFDAVKTGRHITALGLEDIARRWPDFAPSMRAAGFGGVHAIPMTWHGRALGGLNLFWRTPTDLSEDQARTAQAFADSCTLAIMQSSDGDEEAQLTSRVRAALSGRVAIERAKGVLAQLHDLDMAGAFARLIQRSEESEQPLSVTAAELLTNIQTPK
jgi:GAF domain-containing protein